jgi:hypothetical protein
MIHKPLNARDRRSDGLRRWAALFLLLLLVWTFMFVIAPIAQELPMVRPVAAYVEESGINASALYYTGVEEAAEAERYFYHSRAYAPSGP